MKQAVVLAAGEGRRLQPLTMNKPKAMLSVGGKPIIHYVIEALTANGINDIVIVVGYKKELIFNYIGDGSQFNAKITFINQDKQLGSSHALAQAAAALEDEFLVLSGNTLIVPETISRFIKQKVPSILIKKADYPSHYGVVSFENGYLLDIVEKPIQAKSDFISTGIYLFSRNQLHYLQSELTIPEAINSMLAEDVAITVLETQKNWLNVIYPWDILKLNSTILQHIQASQSGVIEAGVQLKGNVSIGQDTLIRSNSYITGPVTIGKGCDIGPNVCISPSTSIGDNVVISPFTEIKNCVIGNDVRISSGTALEDTVIDDGCLVGPNFIVRSEESDVKVDEDHFRVKTGAVIGSSCQIGALVTARAGTIIGDNTRINSMKVISGNIPQRSWIV
jgi:UDP-N-acetylglucosamine diphosphorylase / glucose-1-phosphate thymidylyltransferase / UDP-N-acetylgalactosamine diphosphorylase / glucosamine-1-phosphate N-acetyltransferase / galactosamine-1-phosphate N-acetyltransferase